MYFNTNAFQSSSPHFDLIFQDPKEKIEYYIQHRNEREKQILQCLQENGGPMEPMEIVKKIYLVRALHQCDASHYT